MNVLPCPGFLTGAVAAGLKKDGAPDLGLIFSETPASAAAVFTRNRVQAAPVLLDRRRIRRGRAQAVIVNSGNANCCTGPRGEQDALRMAAAAAAALGIEEEAVLVASTGVIGRPLPIEKVEGAVPALAAAVRADGVMDLARAIMTTDTVPKAVSRRLDAGAGDITVTAVAKGAGMIRPDMATMLCFIMTDAACPAGLLQEMLSAAVDDSFNRITIDGDTSTNDTVVLLANGRSGITLEGDEPRRRFARSLGEVTRELARRLVKDGEGATKLVEIVVRGAENDEQARRVADTVANSSLVKTALFGEDANWGRILAAAGRAGVPLAPERLALFIDQVQIVRGGCGTGEAAEAEATGVLRRPEFRITLDLNQGPGSAEVFTCDFSVDYVRINADYRS